MTAAQPFRIYVEPEPDTQPTLLFEAEVELDEDDLPELELELDEYEWDLDQPTVLLPVYTPAPRRRRSDLTIETLQAALGLTCVWFLTMGVGLGMALAHVVGVA